MGHRSKDIAQRFARIFNHKVTFDKDNATAKFTLPGFHYADFDRAGRLSIFSMNRFMETSRLFAYKHYPDVFPLDRSGEAVMVMFSQKFALSPSLYDKAAMDFPMLFKYSVIGVGRSSIVRKLSLTESSSGEVLATTLQKLVNMNKTTMKSHPLTPEILTFYDGINASQESHEVFEELHPPKVDSSTKMFSIDLKVRHSDMDMLFHTNQGTYMRYALDCASEAAAAGFLTAFEDDVCFYRAKTAATIHLAESFAGDVLGVHVWEDPSNHKLLHFTVTKNAQGRSQIIYYSYIEFNE